MRLSTYLPLSLALMLALSACGDDSDSGASSTSNGTNSTSNGTSSTSNGTSGTSNGSSSTSNGTTVFGAEFGDPCETDEYCATSEFSWRDGTGRRRYLECHETLYGNKVCTVPCSLDHRTGTACGGLDMHSVCQSLTNTCLTPEDPAYGMQAACFPDNPSEMGEHQMWGVVRGCVDGWECVPTADGTIGNCMLPCEQDADCPILNEDGDRLCAAGHCAI